MKIWQGGQEFFPGRVRLASAMNVLPIYQEKRSERMEKKFVRQNSTSYRHSLPGIVENGVYNEQEAADRRSTILIFVKLILRDCDMALAKVH